MLKRESAEFAELDIPRNVQRDVIYKALGKAMGWSPTEIDKLTVPQIRSVLLQIREQQDYVDI